MAEEVGVELGVVRDVETVKTFGLDVEELLEGAGLLGGVDVGVSMELLDSNGLGAVIFELGLSVGLSVEVLGGVGLLSGSEALDAEVLVVVVELLDVCNTDVLEMLGMRDVLPDDPVAIEDCELIESEVLAGVLMVLEADARLESRKAVVVDKAEILDGVMVVDSSMNGDAVVNDRVLAEESVPRLVDTPSDEIPTGLEDRERVEVNIELGISVTKDDVLLDVEIKIWLELLDNVPMVDRSMDDNAVVDIMVLTVEDVLGEEAAPAEDMSTRLEDHEKVGVEVEPGAVLSEDPVLLEDIEIKLWLDPEVLVVASLDAEGLDVASSDADELTANCTSLAERASLVSMEKVALLDISRDGDTDATVTVDWVGI
ncbi:hypothetical protein F4778DRAFT_787460 [Xylariomycetidae sp. FL2044]|nr:hypothetical protein F4778DRAFT_787460 [Xylariomycetidae sp. FL2044]